MKQIKLLLLFVLKIIFGAQVLFLFTHKIMIKYNKKKLVIVCTKLVFIDRRENNNELRST